MGLNGNKKVLSSSKHGKVIQCLTCNNYHFEFKNLLFRFNKDEFTFFKKYFNDFDADFWEQKNRDILYRRKIIVPVGHINVPTLFNKEEVWEPKDLFSAQNKLTSIIKFEIIEREICPN